MGVIFTVYDSIVNCLLRCGDIRGGKRDSFCGGEEIEKWGNVIPAVRGVPVTKKASTGFGEDRHVRPLVLRPAVSGVRVVVEISPQVSRKNRTKSLVHRPARLQIPRRQDIAEEARIAQLQPTLPHRTRVTDKSRDSRRGYKDAVRKWTERKREREEKGRQNERQKLSENRESDRLESPQGQIDPAIIKQEIKDTHANLHRAVGKDEHETLRACNPPSDESHRIMPISETKMSTDTLISALVAEIMKERQHVDEVKNFVIKKHTLEEWQNWGKILVERMDKQKKNWEEYREIRKKEGSRDYGRQNFDKSTRGELPWESLSIQSVYYWVDKLDKVLEEAEDHLPKTHCEWKEVEKKSAEQRAAKGEEAQFVRTKVRDYVESDSDDPSTMGPVKRKRLPLRPKN
ncbi:uncharacterized protein EAF01_009623 [Botrytis porri]|uniref:uncharacterized protein n=1 Tax=Botrytis porri TaxID=87229 RepID=UPI0019000418|nr:uncharacterized protein EAF01_009623 [Botrytis porri]KAF7895661.1 hypothetical protein EAF01_009623 [Botrytis porri]